MLFPMYKFNAAVHLQPTEFVAIVASLDLDGYVHAGHVDPIVMKQLLLHRYLKEQNYKFRSCIQLKEVKTNSPGRSELSESSQHWNKKGCLYKQRINLQLFDTLSWYLDFMIAKISLVSNMVFWVVKWTHQAFEITGSRASKRNLILGSDSREAIYIDCNMAMVYLGKTRKQSW